MTKSNLLFIFLVSAASFSFSLFESEKIYPNFDGLYIGKTGEVDIPGKKMEIFNYVRFYADGTVYTQSVTSYDPEAVSKWFGKKGRFERSGTFKIKKGTITFAVSNSDSPDKQLEGAKTDNYSGKISASEKLNLKIKYASGTTKEVEFKFVRIK